MNKLLLGLIILVSMVMCGCGGNGNSITSSIQSPFIGGLNAKLLDNNRGFLIQQTFSKLNAQTIKVTIRNKSSKETLCIIVFDSYSECGKFNESITMLFDISQQYEASLQIGEYDTNWETFIK